MADIVGQEESLGRYLTQRDHFSRPDNAVRPRAFMPPPSLRLSVFRIDGLSTEAVWDIGQREVINTMSQPSRTLYGMADIKVLSVQENNLVVDPDKTPVRHANIVGWPEGPENKARRKSIAQELAADARLVLK